jgi:hypothetical protein
MKQLWKKIIQKILKIKSYIYSKNKGKNTLYGDTTKQRNKIFKFFKSKINVYNFYKKKIFFR